MSEGATDTGGLRRELTETELEALESTDTAKGDDT
jgi:hypothetical protein